MPNYWLIKSEPTNYAIDDLARDKQTDWTGVRNYQARNFMRDQMKIGDLALFYHSNTEVPGVVGLVRVCSQPHPDRTAFDPTDSHFDPKSDPAQPTWVVIDVEFVEKFPRIVSLAEIKADPELSEMLVAQKGMRLSIQPVNQEHFEKVVRLAKS